MSIDQDRTALLPMETSSRVDRLRDRLDQAGCDALLVTKNENVRYLTGFTGSAGMLLVEHKGALLVTDGRYRDQAPAQLRESEAPVDVTIGRPDAQFDALIERAKGFARLGLEAAAVSWALQTRVAEVFSSKVVATKGLVEALRIVKDEGELSRIERACAIADVALAQVKPRLSEAVTESEFAAELEFEMRRRGASAPAFETIVASGPNSAMPHARPSDRPVAEGDIVVIDFGATVDGYRSDMTRSIFVGSPDQQTSELFEAVLGAQRAGLRAVSSAVTAGEIDRACREYLDDAGYGEFFLHSTGHGVGLEIHESPAVSPGSTDSLPPNTVVAVEPGAYLAGRGGVRIEDTVAVTESGGRVLTHTTKDYTL